MVTFMLNDSFPAKRRAEWEPILMEPNESMRRRKLEAWLDRGQGDCWLGQPHIADVVEEALLQGHEVDYSLKAWVVMPNHVHGVIHVWNIPLSKILKNWKGATARQANIMLGRQGTFWQQDYFDTLIRDDDHLRRAVHYVESNPTRPKYVLDPCDWRWSSARRRDQYGRL
jgi:REP element-mobilizing transposase RayT